MDDDNDFAATGTPGYVYAVAAGSNYEVTKLGRTKSEDPHVCLTRRYQTVLTPLNIVATVPVVDNVVAEAVMKVYFAPRRVDHRHELFDMRAADREGNCGFDHEAWVAFVNMLGELNRANGGPLPEPAEMVRSRREALRTATTRRRTDEMHVVQQAKRERERVRAEAVQRRADRIMSLAARAADVEENRLSTERKHRDAIKSFVEERCEIGRDFRVGGTTFREALNADVEDAVSASAIKQVLQCSGFEYKHARVDGVLMRCISGLRLRA